MQWLSAIMMSIPDLPSLPCLVERAGMTSSESWLLYRYDSYRGQLLQKRLQSEPAARESIGATRGGALSNGWCGRQHASIQPTRRTGHALVDLVGSRTSRCVGTPERCVRRSVSAVLTGRCRTSHSTSRSARGCTPTGSGLARRYDGSHRRTAPSRTAWRSRGRDRGPSTAG